MLSSVLVTALTGILFQSVPGAGGGTVARKSASDELKPLDQPAASALPTKQLPPEEMGDIFMARKRFREALEQYQRCDQNSAVIANKTGIAYHQLLDFRSAMLQYKRATKLDSHYSEAFNNLGTIYYSRKSFRRAVHLYKTALRLAPSSATVYSNLGSAYFSMRRFPDAIAAYHKALSLDPNVFSHASTTGVLLQEQNVEDKALFHYYMARVYAQVGMNDQALQCIRKALEEGFKDRQKFIDEPEFAALKGNPEFVELMKKEQREL
jgi:tetratricopeptide (TPR) repeat protein